MARNDLRTLAVLVGFAAGLSAQTDLGPRNQILPGEQSGGGLLPTSPFRALLERGEVPSTFDAAAGAQRRFRGFPLLTPPDFGAFPGGQLPQPFLLPTDPLPPIPGAAPPTSAWPGWLGASAESFVPSKALIIHSNDYVWVREAEETAYVPLAPYERTMIVGEGTEVDVRGGGQFTVQLHCGASLRALGRAHLALTTMNDKAALVRIDDLSWVNVLTTQRPITIEFGPRLTVESTGTRLVFEKQLDGSITCTNDANSEAVLRLRGEVIVLGHGRRAVLLPAARLDGIPVPLTFDGDVRLGQDGRVLRAQGSANGGTVAWNGTRFRVRGGTLLRIDPLAGREFPTAPN
ncbi:MAG: hypothetical protein AB7I19_02115 [Planctomycetota bacterium]